MKEKIQKENITENILNNLNDNNDNDKVTDSSAHDKETEILAMCNHCYYLDIIAEERI